MAENEMNKGLSQVSIRLVQESPLLSDESINTPEQAVKVLGEWLEGMDRELVCVLNLQADLKPINMNIVSMGALNEAQVHPREVMKSAILSNAACMMSLHNHPSGSLKPSKEQFHALRYTKGEEYGGRYELIAGNCLIGPTSENPYLTKPAVSQAIKDAKNYLEQKEKSHEKQGKHLKITERSKTLPTKKVKEQER